MGRTSFNLFIGVNFSVNLNEMIHINFSPIMKKLEHLFYVWNQRYLTPLGRITIIKTYLYKIKPFIFFSTFSWNCYLKNIEGMFLKFIWNGKPYKIKREALTKNT